MRIDEGQISGLSGSWMIRGIHAACAVFVVLFAASVFLVLDYSVYQANRAGLATERKLVQQEFKHQINEVVKYQAELTFRDDTFAEVTKPDTSDAFVKQRLLDWLWADFGFSWMVLTDDRHRSRLTVRNGEKVAADAADELLFWIDDLLYEATQNYWAELRRRDGGFELQAQPSDRDTLSAPIPYIHAADMRMINGSLSIVVVQAVVPKTGFIPTNSAQPVLMVTVKPISAKMLDVMSARLGIGNLHVASEEEEGERPGAFTPVGNGFTDGPYMVVWTPNSPGPYIWRSASPSVAVLAVLAAFAMAFIGWRFGALVRALQKSESINRFMAKHDTLTGVANRGGFEEALRREVQREPPQPFAIIAVDLDKFKAVNDQHGHGAGDAVLKAIASRFAARVGDRGIVARQGGDEFMVLIPDATDRAEITALANGFVYDAQVPVVADDLLLAIGGSAGFAFYPEHGRNVRDLVHAADEALYAAKNGGRNRAVVAGDVSGASTQVA
ncbi:diguanylate cyclase [Rhizobiaceae bacterium n13]|uniref:Diguanylate cyclase n=1 Tax=Ferirhizobium litorale TaxID=2927786 RepID=A0AAE3QIZ8_9HYPH|nr:diguanylate cyclase [Fererhizobium litorale]MDI7863877.1 diguanylate cyclase [Fererhizobium litorale]MDI7924291.1 diguanylate cyclase [Fererhizobium litorale]